MKFALDCDSLSHEAMERRLSHINRQLDSVKASVESLSVGEEIRRMIVLPNDYPYTSGFRLMDAIIEEVHASWRDVWVRPKGGRNYSPHSQYIADFFGIQPEARKRSDLVRAGHVGNKRSMSLRVIKGGKA